MSKKMREILFRGKCVDTGIWYEGCYIHLHKTTHCPIGDPERFPDNDIHQIVFERMTDWELPNQHLRVDVNPETVGQFTGIVDKNGKKIFEGDFVVCKQEICGNWIDYSVEIGFIEMKHGAFGLHRKQGYYRPFKDWLEDYEYEVIGNIHDNPELLKEALNV